MEEAMPTNNKTSLGLNSWLGTDKPKRSDFVEDNALMDTLLTAHFGDTSKHLSTADRTQLNQSFVVGTYTGNGLASQDIILPFEAKIVFVFFQRRPTTVFQQGAGYNENNFAIVTNSGSTLGVFLDKTKLTVCQTLTIPSGGGILNNFNSGSDNYVYLAFR
jgi:hypothetical protein